MDVFPRESAADSAANAASRGEPPFPRDWQRRSYAALLGEMYREQARRFHDRI